jgi:voltage-gated potassium channel
VIVPGDGDLTGLLLDELEPEADVVAVVTDTDQTAALDTGEHDAVVGDPGDETTLDRAGIDVAQAVVAATHDDAADALAVLTARQLNPDVRIVAAATNRENVTKLKRAGADIVISPTVIGSHLLVESALGRTGMESVADRITGTVSAGATDGAVAEDEASGD